MRRFVIGGALGVFLLSVVLVACGGSGGGSSDAEARRFQDMWEIDQIEKDFHQATSDKDIDLMVSLYAPNATMTVGPGETAAGLDEIREFWLEKSATFVPENNWISDHPAYKLEITVERRPGHAALRVPLRRCRDRRGRGGHGRRLRRGPDRREVADHELGRRDDRSWKSETLAEEQERAGRRTRGGDGSTIRSSAPSPACRSRFGRSC